jgi:hypothetical protein
MSKKLIQESELEFQIKYLMTKYMDIFGDHQWSNERLRLVELFYSLAWRILGRHSDTLRASLLRLEMIGLLDPQILGLLPADDKLMLKSPEAKRIVKVFHDILQPSIDENDEDKLTDSEIEMILILMREISVVLVRDYAGKIQIFLRRQAELILQNTLETFPIKGLSKDNIKVGLTFWFQNIFGLPIPLNDNLTRGFLRRYHSDVSNLVAVADKLDVNVAVVDDLISIEIPTLKKLETKNTKPKMNRG